MPRTSTLTKLNIKVDKNLAVVVGHGEGDLISYTQLVKGIFDYVKLSNLKQADVPVQAAPAATGGPTA